MILKSSCLVRAGVVCLAIFVLLFVESGPLFAQANDIAAPDMGMMTGPQPPMKNVMYNVFWGAGVGAMIWVGLSTLDDSVGLDDRFAFSRLSAHLLTGATYGGIIGLVVGVYLSVQGITFDPNLTRLAASDDFESNFHNRYHSNQNSIARDAFPIAEFEFSF